MREKKELMKSVENKNNVRNEKVQQVLEMYKSIIDNYIEKNYLKQLSYLRVIAVQYFFVILII